MTKYINNRQIALLVALACCTPDKASAYPRPIEMADGELNAPAARASGQQTDPQEILPPFAFMQVLVHSTLSALNQANLTKNYSVLLAWSSSQFQQANSSDRLAESFKSFRDESIDLSPAFLYQPVWKIQPAIHDGVLKLVGEIESRPMKIEFDFSYVFQDGQWRLLSLSVWLRHADKSAQSMATPN